MGVDIQLVVIIGMAIVIGLECLALIVCGVLALIKKFKKENQNVEKD